MSDLGKESSELVDRRIEDWRRRLIDLSHRNRLIAYKATRATTLELAAPGLHELLADPDRGAPWDFYFPPEPDEDIDESASEAATTVDELLLRSQDRHRPRRPNEIEVTEANPKRIARILDNLAKRSNSEFQDKALRVLYIAAGFLDWHDAQRDKSITSPLVLVPVELRRESTRDPYRLFFVEDEEIVINPSLTEKLRRDAGLDVPGDWIWEDKPIGQELDEIRQAIAGTDWTVREDAAIGLFSFQKYVMYRDLLDHEAQVVRHPIVRSLAQGRLLSELTEVDPDVPDPADLDDVQQPSEALSILDADASQRQCVEAAKRGRSFVMQGPPGTGKSQTIANVIAEAIGQGKRVLFVSEKAAALDVVFKRLMASGLDEYCLMLHGEHAGRREVVQALDRSLTTSLQARPGMRSDEMERLANLRTVLNDSAELLHLPQPMLGGRSLREVHAQLAELHDAPSIAGAPEPDAIEGRAVLDDYQSLSEIFQRLSERWQVSPHDYLWRGYSGLRFTADDHGRVISILREVSQAARDLEAPARRVAHEVGWLAPDSTHDAQRLVDLGDLLEHAPALEGLWLDAEPQSLIDAADAGEKAFAELAQVLQTFRETWPARAVDEFSADIAPRLHRARSDVQRRCGWVDQWSGGLDALPQAVRGLDELPKLIAGLRDRARAVAALVGEPSDGLTRQRLDTLADLAELTFKAERRPERQWLVRAGLERAEGVHAELVEDLTIYQRQRAAILGSYDESALQLDVRAIGDRFANQYTSAFSKLSGAYRLDVKAIKSARKDRKLPSTIVEDLKLIADAREVGSRIDLTAERAAYALGSYARGRDTDPEETAKALAVAREAICLSSADVDLQALGDKLALGSEPDAHLAQAAEQLRTASRTLIDRLPDVQRFVATPSQLYEGDIDQLESATSQIEPDIAQLADMIADLNEGAARPVASIEEAERRASLIGRIHELQERIRNDGEAWRRSIGSPFKAGSTDWEATRMAARWLTRIRAFDDGALTTAIRHQLQNMQRTWPEFVELGWACDQMRRAVEEWTAMFESGRANELEDALEHQGFTQIQDLCAHFSARADELRDWTEWRAWHQRAERLGWDAFVDRLVRAEIDNTEVLSGFQRSYWNRRLEMLFEDDPDLVQRSVSPLYL